MPGQTTRRDGSPPSSARSSDTAPVPNAPAIGDVIAGKYRVDGVIAIGGMALVLGARRNER
jgi:hypothetical protein